MLLVIMFSNLTGHLSQRDMPTGPIFDLSTSSISNQLLGL